ncbi:MAG: MFS transporter [Candidatus Daviesbacteria bacterium]|nr:MFS transporter [Candidatus Daviesbacteria bacterium]
MTSKISPFASLKIPVFRNYIFGSFVSEIGNQMQVVAVAWQVYELTRNPASLGLIGLANFLPVLLFSLIGGLFADRFNRRKILLISQSALGLVSLLLLTFSLFHLINPWIIYLVLILQSTASSFSLPARQAVLPALVPKNLFLNAISLFTLHHQSSILIGPAIAGFLIAGFGVESVYLFNVLSFLVFIGTVLMIKVPLNLGKQVEFSTKSILEGVKFVLTTPILYSTMILDFLATFFGTATILMPVFAKDVLHVGPKGLGLLYSAPAVGAVIGGLILSLLPHHQIKHQGKIIISAILFYGVATIGFGLSKNLLLSLFFLSLLGFWDMIARVIRNTVRQMITPDHLRGRMVSVMRIFFQGGPQLGDIEAGLLAAAVGGPVSVVIGGVGVIAITSLVAYFNPKLRNYQGKELTV